MKESSLRGREHFNRVEMAGWGWGAIGKLLLENGYVCI